MVFQKFESYLSQFVIHWYLAVAMMLTPFGANLAQELPSVPKVQRRAMGSDAAELGGQALESKVMDYVNPLTTADAKLELLIGQARTLTLKKPISEGRSVGVVAVGDPSIADFEVLPNPRMLRLSGRRAGVTDLTIILADDSIITFQVLVKYDLEILQVELNQRFPDSQIRVSQIRDSLVLEGQVRNALVASQVVAMVESWLSRTSPIGRGTGSNAGMQGAEQLQAVEDKATGESEGQTEEAPRELSGFEVGSRQAISQVALGSVVNLLRIPGAQQIMLQVRVAELNRTGMREIGADWIFASDNGNAIGTNISGNSITAQGSVGIGGLASTGTGNMLGSSGTAFGIFPSANFDVLLRILRKNALLSILAEPNLVAMSGHEASFLAGGQFPVPVVSGLGGQVSIQYKDFGVQLRFTPTIMDEDTIRLNVSPEVSTIDESTGTTLVPGGLPVPGINTRKVNTTVEMREGETLALAGLLEVALDAQTTRIPGLGDLPYLGPFFSNTTHQRVEKELLVLVTPFFVSASPASDSFSLPGQAVVEPNDLEFYLLGRIEGKTGRSFNTVKSWEDPWNCVQRMKLEQQCLHGPVGFSR